MLDYNHVLLMLLATVMLTLAMLVADLPHTRHEVNHTLERWFNRLLEQAEDYWEIRMSIHNRHTWHQEFGRAPIVDAASYLAFCLREHGHHWRMRQFHRLNRLARTNRNTF